ncbi:GGDEF domain-containing protein [Paraneptunicella aestuarii]|uniref:GGDEF domain-containing protein n=1 Tax=Paraneptunicella aestuarii TaxID=2831148 RepID=UPI001E41B597|nr:GGDEF domain-containing protein [Paraneptunicella aestuarii]UAA39762.1 GGDEF domain-containing protein [Paraneptunicella aestuarii]
MPAKSIEKLNEAFGEHIVNYVSDILKPKAESIAATFYRELSHEAESSFFLDNEKVEKQLKFSFTRWAETIFSLKKDFDKEGFYQLHNDIGTIHARIGVPMELVDYGMQIVKDYSFQLYLNSADNKYHAEGVVYINKLLDACLSVINQSYVNRSMVDERNAQALRLKMASSDLSLECERIRSEMIAWSREIITFYASGNISAMRAIADVRHTNCGLWFVHKAGLYFPDSPELEQIGALLDDINGYVQARFVMEECQCNEQAGVVINGLNVKVNEVCWLLEQVSDKNSKETNSKDPLTQLLSRRFVDGIFKREIALCEKQKERFGLLMIDIDNFKLVNDTYGHQVGDRVLRDVSSNILHNVRPTDFCFRYGGEEILVLLSAVDKQGVLQKAEQIRQCIESHITCISEHKSLRVTVSIGVAVYDGHPDYQHTINEADMNLYRAKNNGKNMTVAA